MQLPFGFIDRSGAVRDNRFRKGELFSQSEKNGAWTKAGRIQPQASQQAHGDGHILTSA